MARDQVIQAVLVMLREQSARQANGAQHIRRKDHACAAKGILEERIVEPGVVGDKQSPFEARHDLVGDVLEGWRIGHHRVGDAGQRLDFGWNGGAGVDQR